MIKRPDFEVPLVLWILDCILKQFNLFRQAFIGIIFALFVHFDYFFLFYGSWSGRWKIKDKEINLEICCSNRSRSELRHCCRDEGKNWQDLTAYWKLEVREGKNNWVFYSVLLDISDIRFRRRRFHFCYFFLYQINVM